MRNCLKVNGELMNAEETKEERVEIFMALVEVVRSLRG